MAHAIENMMYNEDNGKPWHRLGVPVNGLATAHEALEKSGLDWEVEKLPLSAVAPNGEHVYVPRNYANTRLSDNKVLGVVGERYRPLQNKDAFEFFDPIVDRDEAIYETAGSLNGGKQIWLLAKLPAHIRIGNTDDLIDKYVMLTNSHDGSKPVIGKVTPIRVVCSNTLSLAIKSGGDEFRIRHTKTMMNKLQEAHKVLGLVNKVYEEVDTVFNRMADVKMNTESINDYYNTVFNKGRDEQSVQMENTIMDVQRLIDMGAGVDDPSFRPLRGSAWHIYNTVTEYVDHYKEYSKKTDRSHALTFGTGATIKQRAYKEALKLL